MAWASPRQESVGSSRTTWGPCVNQPDDLKGRIAKLVELGKNAEENAPQPTQGHRAAMDFVFPVVRRKFPRHPWVEPLRHNIDYQPSPRKSLLSPPFQCGECGGGLWEEDEHKKDPETCRQEKIRQVMES